jgi:hypothetical protein
LDPKPTPAQPPSERTATKTSPIPVVEAVQPLSPEEQLKNEVRQYFFTKKTFINPGAREACDMAACILEE